MEVPRGAIASGPDRRRRGAAAHGPRRGSPLADPRDDGVAVYLSADEVSLNTLTVTRRDRIEFRDPPAYQGSDVGTCRPGETTDDANVFVIQAFCPAAGVTRVKVDLGNREDTATVTPTVPSEVLGGDGADTLTTGDQPDTVDGGLGNDRMAAGGGNDIVIGGAGVDDIDAGPGDDDIRVRDGLADTVRCGEGTDRVDADSFDQLAADCEGVARTVTPPPPESAATATDKTAPKVDAGAATLQRVGKRGVIRIAATSSERGTVAASGFIDIGGLSLPLANVSRPDQGRRRRRGALDPAHRSPAARDQARAQAQAHASRHLSVVGNRRRAATRRSAARRESAYALAGAVR